MGDHLVLGIELKSVSDLEKMGYVLMEDEEFPVTNNIMELLEERNMSATRLSEMIGITRQSVNAIIRGKMKPGIDFGLKASQVLGVKVEDMFKLTSGAWVHQVSTFRESAVYLDMRNLEIIGRTEQRKRKALDNMEYIEVSTGRLLTKEEMDAYIVKYKEEHLQAYTSKLEQEEPSISHNQIAARAHERINKEIDAEFSLLYKRVGKRVNPKGK